MQMHDTHQQVILHRLEYVLLAFFLLAALFLVAVYVAAPSIYTQTLLLQLSPTDRYPLAATLFLVGILVFVAIVIVGIMRHWRWLFWIPAMTATCAGVTPAPCAARLIQSCHGTLMISIGNSGSSPRRSSRMLQSGSSQE